MTPVAREETTKPLPPVTAGGPGSGGCGDFNIRISRDGTWHYRGSPINRKALVCLFASVLKRGEDGSYVLETPVERGRIEVEDAPFVAVELCWRHCHCDHGGGKQQCLTFRTNLDQVFSAGPDNPIRVETCPRTGEPRPYVLVRPGLEARINRAVFYEMVALSEPESVDGRPVLGVWSQGVFFPIGEPDADALLDDEDEEDGFHPAPPAPVSSNHPE